MSVADSRWDGQGLTTLAAAQPQDSRWDGQGLTTLAVAQPQDSRWDAVPQITA